MFSPVAGTGFASFFPPMVTRCFTAFATRRSTLPGWRPPQPTSRTAATSVRDQQLRIQALRIGLLDHDCHLHVAVTRTAEVVADRGISPGSLRRERHFGGFSWLDHRVDLQRLLKEAVCDVLG